MNEEDLNPFRSPSYKASGSADKSKPEKSEFDYGKLVTLASFGNSIEAHALKDMLAENGIESRVTNEEAAASLGIMAGTSFSFSPAVMIREEDAEAGLAIKQKFLAGDFAASSGIAEWVCSCGETVDAGFEVCWNCQAAFSDQPEKG